VPLYRDQGVVLRTIKLGETDRIVTVLTQGHGRIRAVAKGVRKPGSRFGARLANRALREHYGCLTHAVSMLEATDQVSPEREPNPALYRMLVGALRTLADRPSPLVSAAFFWKLLSLEGFHPLLDECARCGGAGPFVAFSAEDGGVVCEQCGRVGGRRVGPDALALVGRILGGDLRGALAEPPGAATSEVERLALSTLEHHLERRLRSAALL
jgi:DNA repair protein RecO (recombination protein O)